jgi:hypothetical protein
MFYGILTELSETQKGDAAKSIWQKRTELPSLL